MKFIANDNTQEVTANCILESNCQNISFFNQTDVAVKINAVVVAVGAYMSVDCEPTVTNNTRYQVIFSTDPTTGSLLVVRRTLSEAK